MSATSPVELPGIEPVRRIGSGGFGDVWLARQVDFDRDVAVKVGRRALTSGDDRRRFERECKALGRLTGHPHVIGVYTSGFQNDLPYLVMEYVEGGTLADHGPTLGEPKLRSIAAQLCDAVAAAHAIGVLHRDLKPENVFLRNDHTAVLGDFGIARLGDGNNTAAPQLTATLAFAPPEILNGHPPSIQADVYGIGVTIAAAAIGRSPFAPSVEMVPEAIMARVLDGALPDLQQYGLSPEFAQLLQLAMSHDPGSRPQSAVELGQRLNALSAVTGEQAVGSVQHAPPPGTVTNVVASPAQPHHQPPIHQPLPDQHGQASKTPKIVAGIGLALTGLIAVVGAAVYLNGRGDDTATVQVAASTESDAEPAQETESTVEDAASTTVPQSTTAPESTTTITVATTVAEVAPSPPLAMPLSSSEVSELTDIPIDDQGWDEIFGPANSPQFCDVRPDVTGLVDTTAALYPIDPTVGGNLQQVTIRMYRFDSAELAVGFLESSTEITCESWESDGNPARAEETVPVTRYGDETRQVDQVIELQNSVDLLTRSVFVQHGTDVMKLVLLTIDPADLDPVTDGLVGRAVDALGYDE